LLSPTEALTRPFEFDAASSDADASANAAAPATRSCQGLRIGELGLMIDYADGSELAALPATTRLPNAPPWFIGIANLHGALLPVFDLAPRLGIAHAEQAPPMLLVLGHGDASAGVVIDGLPQRLRVRPDDRLKHAPVLPALHDCVDAGYWVDERPWLALRVDALLNQLCDELKG
jgi:purine-binding chemotaxis protein CheW